MAKRISKKSVIIYVLVLLLLLGALLSVFIADRAINEPLIVKCDGDVYTTEGALYFNPGEKAKFNVDHISASNSSFLLEILPINTEAAEITYRVIDEDGEALHRFTEIENFTDYFKIEKFEDGFMLVFPDDFSLESAILSQYAGAKVDFISEINYSCPHFKLIVTCGEDTCEILFDRFISVGEVFLDGESILFGGV